MNGSKQRVLECREETFHFLFARSLKRLPLVSSFLILTSGNRLDGVREKTPFLCCFCHILVFMN